MKAATQVWLGVALLHREQGRDRDFAKSEIERRIQEEHWIGGVTAETLSSHISGHSVASSKPSPDRDRLLTRTSRGRYRLYRPGDVTHEGRAQGRTTPDENDLPAYRRDLLCWYAEEYAQAGREAAMEEFVRLMRESGAFRGVDADSYVRDLRSGWDDAPSPTEAPPIPRKKGAPRELGEMLELRKLAMESGIWKGIDPDQYVRELREGWD